MSSNNKLTEKDFISASAYIDDELSEDEKLRIQELQKHHVVLKKFIQSEKEIKNAHSQTLERRRAPEALKKRIQDKLKQELLERDSKVTSISDAQTKEKESENHNRSINPANGENSVTTKDNKTVIKKLFPYLAIAASILIIVSIGFLSTGNETSNDNATATVSIESYTFKHFNEHAQLINNNISISDIENAEKHIREQVNKSMVVPKLNSANFNGVEMIEFISGYKTPVLVYNQPDINEYIYIFTFDLNQFPSSKLKRNELAIKNCIKQSDYFVENVNGKHVVSWKWGTIWYTAISNHDGNKLAALVEPLNQ
mgnify:CR=1 FL=1